MPTQPAAIDDQLLRLRRNPTIKLIVKLDAPPAKTYQAHVALAQAEAQELGLSSLFCVVQRRKELAGFWVSEWTVARGDGDARRSAARRRVGKGATLEAAVDNLLKHPSTGTPRPYLPEEGLLGRVKRLCS